ncbi:MAG: hypothetical protein B6244_13665 [Candidatus Cloacimonetes bacterium 4572_55]|nr:MAG: hypothetical protein B6244_13665 [Candidatus Cloacimonetes bacterium 4572_55]
MSKSKLIIFSVALFLSIASLGWAQIVTFSVDMSVQEAEFAFDPETDQVRVRGSFDWDNGFIMEDAENDLIYMVEADLSAVENGTVEYKFLFITEAGDAVWESVDNRTFDHDGSSQTLPTVYFDNDEEINPTAPFRLFLGVDMSIQEVTGNFNPGAGDFVGIRGSLAEFGSWSDTQICSPIPGQDGFYRAEIEIGSYALGSSCEFKFVKELSDGTVAWESVSNRPITLTGEDMQNFDGEYYQYLYEPEDENCVYFDCLTPNDFIVQDVTVTYQVDISSAITWLTDNPDSCLPDVQSPDPLFWICSPEDVTSVYINGSFVPWWGWGTIPTDYNMTVDPNNSDLYSWVTTYQAGHPKRFEYKFGLNSYDNESTVGGNHQAILDDSHSTQSIEDCFGSIREDIVDWPECDWITAIEEQEVAASDFQLFQNSPNPFNPSTTISYRIDVRSPVALTIYNAAGQVVRTLDQGVQEPAKIHQAVWDGTANNGSKSASGIYFYQLKTDTRVEARKMILLK